MAANPVYIESDEEIPEVIDRIRRSPASEIPLVVPTRSRLGQSRFNFQLLRQYATQLGKRVAIITADPAVQQMAEESGFRSFGAVDEYGGDLSEESVTPAAGEPAGTAAAAVAAPTLARPAAPARPAPAAPRIVTKAPLRLPSREATEVRPGRFLLYAGAGILLVCGIVAATLYVPSAQVTVVADAKPFSVSTIDVAAAPGQAPIRVRVLNSTKTSSQGFKVTGTKTTPGTVATGTAVYNNSCPFGLQIPNGQRLQAKSNGDLFAQQGDIEVKQGSTASVPIVATSPGAGYNVGAGDISVIQGNAGFSCLTVTNPSPTSGGADEKKEPQMTQGDYDLARGQLEQQLRKDISDDLAKQAQQGEKVSDKPIFSAPDLSTDHKVGDVVSSFTATMTLKAEGAAYVADDVTKAFSDRLDRQIPSNEVRTDNKVQVEPVIASATPGGHLDFQGKATAFVGPRLDFQAIKSKLAGKSVGQASAVLKQYPVQSAEIRQSPFRLPLMPLVASRIDIKYVVQQGQAPTA